jgi:hypothetical protein
MTQNYLLMYIEDQNKYCLIRFWKCSWKNRAKEWCNVLKITKSIAIFNSFPFHYEMFGHIIHFAKENGYHVDIYTTTVNHLGWFDFYSTLFDNFTMIHYKHYKCDNGYPHIFVTTDDDPYFKNEWDNDRVICLNHTHLIRIPGYKKHINIAKFKDSDLEYSIPCYPVVNLSDKVQNNVVTVIGGENASRIELIECIRSSDGKPVTINILGRSVTKQ